MSALFPSATGWVLVALWITTTLFFVAEAGILATVLRRRNASRSQRLTEIVWTIVPGMVLVAIALLAR